MAFVRAPALHAVEPLEPRTLLASWTQLTNLAPTSTGTMMLLSDGTVMAQRSGTSSTWYKLTPDSTGGYVGGTWSARASMNLQRLYFASNVLQDGRVFIVGGEYSGSSGTNNHTNAAEMYDPVTNTWANLPSHPDAQYGDVPSAMLPDGRVVCGSLTTANTFIYDPATNSWSAGPTKLAGDRSNEETWVKLSDDSILSYNEFGTNVQGSQRLVPSLNAWVDSGPVPVQLHTSVGHELGAAMRLPDGRIFFMGGTNHNALYSPPATISDTGSWGAAPDTPNSNGANDAPAAEFPNGHVFYAAGDTSSSFNPPAFLYDYDPVANSITQVTGGPNLANTRPYSTRMLILPTGQVLFAFGSSRLWVYTPDGAADPSWQPTISSIGSNGDGTFTLSGTQLNGISEGASYGDDVEMSENYPVVRLTTATGLVSYARTFGWNSTGVGIGGSTSVQFALPAGVSYSAVSTVTVIGAGIASQPFVVGQPNGIWTGLGDGTNWTDANNWSNNAIPFITDNVVINVAANPTIVVSGSQSVQTVNSSEALNITGTLTFSSTSQFDAPVTLSGTLAGNGSATFNNALNWTGSAINGNGTLTVSNTGSLTVGGAGVHTMNRPLVLNGLGSLTAGGNQLLRLNNNTFTIGATGKLDLNDNDFLLDYTGATQLPAVQSYINAARTGGTWLGTTGLTSTTAKNNAAHNTTLAAMQDADYTLGTFDGIAVPSASVLVKYTYYGDTDFSGNINFDDYVKLDVGYNSAFTGWANGDFNGDGLVNFDDYVSIDVAFNTQSDLLGRRPLRANALPVSSRYHKPTP